MEVPIMKRLISILAISAITYMPLMATEDATESIRLKDGSTLYIDDKGDMKMIDKQGDRMTMRDGVAMETMDGRVIMMQNNVLWQRMQRGTLNPKF
jgi:hypothetical protein